MNPATGGAQWWRPRLVGARHPRTVRVTRCCHDPHRSRRGLPDGGHRTPRPAGIDAPRPRRPAAGPGADRHRVPGAPHHQGLGGDVRLRPGRGLHPRFRDRVRPRAPGRGQREPRPDRRVALGQGLYPPPDREPGRHRRGDRRGDPRRAAAPGAARRRGGRAGGGGPRRGAGAGDGGRPARLASRPRLRSRHPAQRHQPAGAPRRPARPRRPVDRRPHRRGAGPRRPRSRAAPSRLGRGDAGQRRPRGDRRRLPVRLGRDDAHHAAGRGDPAGRGDRPVEATGPIEATGPVGIGRADGFARPRPARGGRADARRPACRRVRGPCPRPPGVPTTRRSPPCGCRPSASTP